MSIENEILKEFKPILIVYYPYFYNYDKEKFQRLNVLKGKLGDEFLEKYYVLFIPHSSDDFKLDVLSVLKSKFIKDTDLEKYVKNLQKYIQDNER